MAEVFLEVELDCRTYHLLAAFTLECPADALNTKGFALKSNSQDYYTTYLHA